MAQHYWNLGFAHRIKPNLQVDANVGTVIDAKQALLYDEGLSIRLSN